MVLRQLDPDFARRTVGLALSGNGPLVGTAGIPPPYQYEYLYPSDCLRTRQVRPAAGSYDINDPLPVRWAVGLGFIISGQTATPTKMIWTNQVAALLVYTSRTPTEDLFDASTSEAIVRHLASPLAMAIAGRPDFAKSILEQAQMIAQMAEGHDDGY